jgi:hypothetical protein
VIRPLNAQVANLLLILCGIAAGLVICELFLRLSGFGENSFYVFDRHLGWSMRPGTEGWESSEGQRVFVRVNRWGFRGPDVTLSKPPGTLRIVLLGDSVAEARQVPYRESFCSVIERKLRECPPLQRSPDSVTARKTKAAEVLDFGCDGYGTAQELIMLRQRVWRFAPDVVVLVFFSGNDVRNNSVRLEGDQCRPFFLVRDGQLALGGPFEDSASFRARCALRFGSRRFQLLNFFGHLRGILRWRRVQKKVKQKGAEPGLDSLVYRAPASADWREAWRTTEAEITQMHREVALHHALFLVVTATTGVQVYPDPAVRQRFLKWIGGGDFFYPNQRLKALGEQNGFEVLNLAAPLQAYAEKHQVFLHGIKNNLKSVGHWNALGHQLAGELIATKICQMMKERRPSQ